MDARKEQKIFHRYYSSVEVCGKCGGNGKISVFEEKDIWKQKPPTIITCPLCEGSGMLKKTVTTITDLQPFKQEKY